MMRDEDEHTFLSSAMVKYGGVTLTLPISLQAWYLIKLANNLTLSFFFLLN
jgi:hypothetical protein